MQHGASHGASHVPHMVQLFENLWDMLVLIAWDCHQSAASRREHKRAQHLLPILYTHVLRGPDLALALVLASISSGTLTNSCIGMLQRWNL